ncbi:hypothetical protein [Bradyrhizobium sp. ARR65]|uniref:hypothetical protein n=1 Tax=Bradyrhizobium sp. ARR65 TaxID=1040989 RepID=UPI0006861BA6|nr:hypothetical protein [Bradyrhizobium sp. ARR65]
MSTMTTSESGFQEAATYGGFVDAIGGVATIVLAIVALSGINQPTLAAIATIVFGAALLIQGGTMLTEYTKLMFPAGVAQPVQEGVGGGGLPILFLVGASGIVLGILALLGIAAGTLVSCAVIAFGAALLVSSNSVWHLYRTKQQASQQMISNRVLSGGEILAGEMASGSAAVQLVSGVAAIVLGILAVSGVYTAVLSLVALLVMGATVLLTGSTLSGAAMSFMEPAVARRGGTWAQSPGVGE